MEHSPSLESNSHSASQEISCLLWNPKIHYRVRKSPQVRDPVWHFVTSFFFFFYGEELSTFQPTLRLEDHPLSAVRNCLFSTFAAPVHMGGGGRIFHLQPKDTPSRGDKKPT
jgi:hypothetical protein